MTKRIKRAIAKTARRAVDTVATLLMDQPSIDHAGNVAPTAATVASGEHNPRVGRFTGMGIAAYQNWVFACNATDHQSDDAIAANFTREHPRSALVVKNGGTFPVTGPNGRPHYIRGMRSQYNAGRHHNVAPATPLSRYDANGEPMAGRAPKTPTS